MTGFTAVKRDFLAGVFILLIGLLFAGFGLQYPLGTLAQMGSGFYPVALGVILSLLGVVISISAFAGEPEPLNRDVLPARPDWRGWGCITGGVGLFIVLGEYLGLLPAIFGCVFLAAWGDRQATLKGSFILAASVTAFGTFLFVYVLQISFPVFRF